MKHQLSKMVAPATMIFTLSISSQGQPSLAISPWSSATETASSGTIGNEFNSSQVMNLAQETLYLDMRIGWPGPAIGTQTLDVNAPYLIQVSGTFSGWYAYLWSSYTGQPEDFPMLPSPGVQNGKVGADVAYAFAAPAGYGACHGPNVFPCRLYKFEISLDGGATWFLADPIYDVYTASHIYQYAVVGQGFPPRFRWPDPNVPDDNYGVLTITISPTCQVPFFWQRDPSGIRDHPLRGTCGANFDTLGEGGCTLTAATMLFRHYGADTTTNNTAMTPPNLSDCMNTKACPFDWITGAACSNGKAWTPRREYSFSYERLNQELNQVHRPVILQMCKKSDCSITHWVLVVGGQGNDPANYTIWDPWFECGQNMRLNSRSDMWDFIGMATYDGTPTCSFSAEVPLCARSVSPIGVPTGKNVAIVEQTSDAPANIAASSTVSGTATLYRATDITMTVHLAAQSSVGNVTDMVVWSDTISNTVWQPFAPYVWLPISDLVYAQFRDEMGNISTVVSDTPNPSGPPVAPDPDRVYLPLVMRQ